jgi:hypothetical protein
MASAANVGKTTNIDSARIRVNELVPAAGKTFGRRKSAKYAAKQAKRIQVIFETCTTVVILPPNVKSIAE